MDYNGAEKGCSATKEELVMELAALPDQDDAYLSGEKRFIIIRRFYVEYDRRACCPSIDGQPPEMPQPVKSYLFISFRPSCCSEPIVIDAATTHTTTITKKVCNLTRVLEYSQKILSALVVHTTNKINKCNANSYRILSSLLIT